MRSPRYEPRLIQFARVEYVGGCRLKRYHILRTNDVAQAALVADALAVVDTYVVAAHERMASNASPWWTLTEHRVGSLIIHQGVDTHFVLLDLWVDDNMLRHHVWSAPRAGCALTSLRDADLVMCVWELAVLQHERAAWLRHVLRNDAPEDIDAYLRDTLTRWV